MYNVVTSKTIGGIKVKKVILGILVGVMLLGIMYIVEYRAEKLQEAKIRAEVAAEMAEKRAEEMRIENKYKAMREKCIQASKKAGFTMIDARAAVKYNLKEKNDLLKKSIAEIKNQIKVCKEGGIPFIC